MRRRARSSPSWLTAAQARSCPAWRLQFRRTGANWNQDTCHTQLKTKEEGRHMVCPRCGNLDLRRPVLLLCWGEGAVALTLPAGPGAQDKRADQTDSQAQRLVLLGPLSSLKSLQVALREERAQGCY